jgi:hypothetical protein
VVRSRDFKLVGTRVIDLSSRGMLVETDARVLTGEAVVVTFEAPDGGGWVDCEGTVTRVLHGRRRNDRRRAMGIAFDTLDPCSELWLCEHLRATPLARTALGVAPGDSRGSSHGAPRR